MRSRSYSKRVNGLILVLSFAVLLCTCKKETDAFDYLQLIGKWEMVTEYCKEYFEGELVLEDSYAFDPGEMFIEFRSDGTGYTSDEDTTYFNSFEWSRNDTRININSEEADMISGFNILSLDQNMLVYLVDTYEDQGQGVIDYLYTCQYTLSKVNDGS